MRHSSKRGPWVRLALIAALAALAPLALLAPGMARASDVPETRRWHEAFVTLVNVDFGADGFQARWEYFHCDCGDILVRVEQTAPEGVLTGEILVIGGKALAARGMVSLSPNLEPMLQPPSVMMHLAFTLLEAAVPKGPASVTARQSLSAGAQVQDLEIDSGMATGRFPAPWSLVGEAWPSGDGQRRFELRFEFANPTPTDAEATTTFTFSGGQDFLRDDFPVSGETPLEGWKLQWATRGETEASDAPAGLTVQAVRDEAQAAASTP